MRQLLTVMALFLSIENAYSFQDPYTKDETQKLIQGFQAQSYQQRVDSLQHYKNFLYNRLNRIELPDIDTTSDEDPRFAEYASLTEFDTNVDLIVNRIGKTSCANIEHEINSKSSRSGDVVVDEATEAVRILSALCK